MALAIAAPAQELKIEKYTLPNGMTVILHEDHSAPIACVNIWFRVGSKDEADRRSGFAHLFEHLMFMGTERVPTGQFDKIMEGGGGQNNASTAEDRTNYFESGPASLLPTLLWLEADRLEDLGRTMTQKKLDLQREVVRNERRQNTENTPYGRAFEALNGLMYPAGHPYHTSVIGSHEDLEAASVKDVQDFFSTYYVPNNASMVIAGDFDPKEIKALIGKLFGTLPRRNDVPRKSVPAASFNGVRRMTMVDKVQASRTIMCWPSPAAYQPGDNELTLAGSILTNGVSSRLYKRLVVDEKLATDVSANQNSLLLGSTFLIYATAEKGASLDKIETIIDEELTKFTRSGPTGDELRRLVAAKELETVRGFQSIMAKADRLNEFEFYLGQPNSFRKMIEDVRKASPASVRDAARQTLDLNRRLILRVVPESDEVKDNPRKNPPAASSTKTFTPQNPESFTLSNGIKVQFWRREELPLMALRFRFSGGADSDGAPKQGLAALTADMLSQGAGSLDAGGFENALNLVGATFAAGAGRRESSASLDCLARTFDASLALAADALRRPKLLATEFDREKRLTIAGIEQADDSPTSLASRIGAREFYGADHPFGRPAVGFVESVKGLSIDDLKREYARIYNPAGLTIYAAGSLTKSELQVKLDKAFGDWKSSSSVAARATYPTAKNDHLRVVIVDKPGAVQTVVRFYAPATTYRDPNRIALEAFTTILGGTFTSRLNQNLREDKGYTYGAGSGFNFEEELGTFTASAEVRTDVTGASIKEILAEFTKIATEGVSPEEAAKAAATRRNGVVEGLSTLGGVLGTAIGLAAHDRPFSDVAMEYDAIGKIDAASINGVAPKAFNREKGLFVLVGDRAQIEKQLAGLGLPKPEIVK